MARLHGILLAAYLVLFCTGIVHAADECIPPPQRYSKYRDYRSPPTNIVIYKTLNRHGAEREIAENWNESDYYRDWWQQKEKDAATEWSGILDKEGIKTGYPPRNSYMREIKCAYETGADIYAKLAETEAPDDWSFYSKRWVRNQNRVYAACIGDDFKGELEFETDASDPPRAKEDREYQKASFDFYKGDLDTAYRQYKAMLDNPKHAYRGYAGYMTARILKELGKEGDAYELATKLAADERLKDYRKLYNSIRFVMGYYGCSSGESCLKMHTQHLSFMRNNLLNTESGEDAKGNYIDSNYHLYFYTQSLPSVQNDAWWFTPRDPKSPRLLVYSEAAKKDEFLDWIQAEAVSNPADDQWFTYLYYTDKAKEIQTAVIDHALQRWKAGDGEEWLYLAALRVYPAHPAFDEVSAAAQKLYERLSCAALGGERLMADKLWPRTVFFRIQKSLPDDLIAELVSQKKSLPEWYRESVTPNIVRLFLRQKRFSDIKKLADGYKKAGYYHPTLLAISLNFYKTPEEAFAALKIARSGEMLPETLAIGNALRVSRLLDNLEADRVPKIAQSFLARVAFVRAVLLNDEDLFERAAERVIKTHPFLKDEMATLLDDSGGEPDAWQVTYFLLKNPRFNAYSNEINASADTAGIYRHSLKFNSIDTYNHRDNNWWCKPDPQHVSKIMGDRLFRDIFWWRGGYDRYGQGETFAWDRHDNMRDLLNYSIGDTDILPAFLEYAHSDEWAAKEELALLATKPSASQYLAEETLRQADSVGFVTKWLTDKGIHMWDSPPIPEMLHRSVKVARYGCGGGGDETYKAFRRLHLKFPDSTWTKLTPYWFKQEDKR